MADEPYLTDTEIITASDEYQAILADQVEVARLRPTQGDLEVENEWTLSSAGPVTFPDVAFIADGEQAALENAKAWLARFFEENPDQIP